MSRQAWWWALFQWLARLFGANEPEARPRPSSSDQDSDEHDAGLFRREYRDELTSDDLAELRRALWSVQVNGGPSIGRLDDAGLRNALVGAGLGHLADPIPLDDALEIVERHLPYLGPLAHQDLADWLVAGGTDRRSDRAESFVESAPQGRQELIIENGPGGIDAFVGRLDPAPAGSEREAGPAAARSIDGPPVEPVERTPDQPPTVARFTAATTTVIDHPDFTPAGGVHVTNRRTTVGHDPTGTYITTEADVSRPVSELADNLDPQNWNYIATFIDLAQRFGQEDPAADGVQLCDHSLAELDCGSRLARAGRTGSICVRPSTSVRR